MKDIGWGRSASSVAPLELALGLIETEQPEWEPGRGAAVTGRKKTAPGNKTGPRSETEQKQKPARISTQERTDKDLNDNELQNTQL